MRNATWLVRAAVTAAATVVMLLSSSFVGASTDRPIIGILTQPLYHNHTEIGEYIAASYVKFVESAGGRVVAVHHSAPDAAIVQQLRSLNGVLFPGGANYIDNTTRLHQAGAVVYRFALESNANGDPFPLWGTCLGMELLAVLTASDDAVVCKRCVDAHNVSLALDFLPSARGSRLFSGLPASLWTAAATRNITANEHRNSLLPTTLASTPALANFYTALALSTDPSTGTPFVAAMEGNTFPFFGVQFHPEKSPFEFNPSRAVVHTADAVGLSQWLGTVLVREARLSSRAFPSEADEDAALIYNHDPEPDPNAYFAQVYLWR